MEQEKKQAVALMRYSAIAPLITGTQEDYESLSAYFRTVSAKGIKAPDGSLRHYSPGTLEKWYLTYRKSGFDALVPTGRSDCGVSRKIDEDLKEQIIYLKHHYGGFIFCIQFRLAGGERFVKTVCGRQVHRGQPL